MTGGLKFNTAFPERIVDKPPGGGSVGASAIHAQRAHCGRQDFPTPPVSRVRMGLSVRFHQLARSPVQMPLELPTLAAPA